LIDRYRWGVLNKVQKRSILDFEGATLCEFALAASRLAEDVLAVAAGDHGLGVAEDYGSLVAASALHVHEVAVGGGNQSFEFVGLSFVIEGGVQEISVHLW
jgi:hypothetical protein